MTALSSLRMVKLICGRAVSGATGRVGRAVVMQQQSVEDAVRNLRALILAGERYRQVLSEYVGLGVTETQAVSYLTVHGDRGQNELAADLGLSSGASTALVDRLEREGIAERYPHPNDRRRTLVRLTSRGHAVVEVGRRWLLAGFQDIPKIGRAHV